MSLNNFRNTNASKFKDLAKNMTKSQILTQIQTKKITIVQGFWGFLRNFFIEQTIINEQGGIFFMLFKQADPKKCVQGWEKIQKC